MSVLFALALSLFHQALQIKVIFFDETLMVAMFVSLKN